MKLENVLDQDFATSCISNLYPENSEDIYTVVAEVVAVSVVVEKALAHLLHRETNVEGLDHENVTLDVEEIVPGLENDLKGAGVDDTRLVQRTSSCFCNKNLIRKKEILYLYFLLYYSVFDLERFRWLRSLCL